MTIENALRSGLVMAAVTISFNPACGYGQIHGIGRERLAEALSLQQEYGFEELPERATSCPVGEEPVIPNPLVYDVLTVSDPVCITTRVCGTEVFCQANPNDMTLVLSDDGASIAFAHKPHLIALELLVHSGFQMRITDGNGATAEVPSGGWPVGPRLPVWAFQAPAGIAMLELYDFSANQLASVFVETTPAPPLSPGSLTARAISPTAIELSWIDYSLLEHGFLVERKVGPDGPWEVRASVGKDANGAVLEGLEPSTEYFFRVRAINNAGYSLYSNEAVGTTMTEFTATFESSPGGDGFVIERSEHANIGGVAVANFGGPGALRAGDTAANQQHKAFVSFNTSGIPDDAIVIDARLKLTRGIVVGTNPFWTHGQCVVDMKGGAGFGARTVLQSADFQALPHRRSMDVLVNTAGRAFEAGIPLNALKFVDKTGVTQFRIYFVLDDNNDRSPDWIGWYSGESTEASNRPAFEVTYWR